MGLHVFQLGGNGSCYYRGEFVGETDHSFKFVDTLARKPRLAPKYSHVIGECNDPVTAAEEYRRTITAAKKAALVVLKGCAS